MKPSFRFGATAIATTLSLLAAGFLQPLHALDLKTLPHAPDTVYPSWSASTDKARKNQDYILLKPGQTVRIPIGGALVRLWFTSQFPEKTRVILKAAPRITANPTRQIVLLDNGRARFGEFYEKAWVRYFGVSPQGGLVAPQLPELGPESSLIITNESEQESKFYYQVAAQPEGYGDIGADDKGKTQSISEFTLEPGAVKDIFTGVGVGVLEALSLHLNARDKPFSSTELLNNLRLQATWNQDKDPAVDVTLAQLAGGWSGTTIPDSTVGKLEKNTFTLRWPMPLPTKRKITLRNESKTAVKLQVQATIRKDTDLPTALFYAREGSGLTETGKPFDILQVKGRGALAGLNLDMRPKPDSVRRTYAYLEGNEIIKADGRTYEGTGTEDFFNSAWYFPDKPFSRPFHGLTRKLLSPPSVTAYRFLIPDAVPFRNMLDFKFGHSGRNLTSDMLYRWVVFWYQQPGGTFSVQNTLQNSVGSGGSATTAAPGAGEEKWDAAIKILLAVALVAGTLAHFIVSSRRRKAAEKSGNNSQQN